MLQKAGGTFTLLAEVDFGASFGLKSLYYKSRTSNVADAGQVRLARADVISWRNQANNANLDLSVDASNNILFNGVSLAGVATVADTATIDLTLTGTQLTADIVLASITNAYIANAAAIAVNKLAALTASRAVATDGSGFLTVVATTATELGYVNGVTSAIQTQLDGKQASGDYITELTGDVTATGPGSAAATIANGAITNAKVNAAAAIAYSKLNLSDSIVNADINSAAAIAYSKLNLAGAIVNADINASAAIAFSKMAALSNSIVPVTNGSGVITSSAVTATELSYLSGVTSAIQTQINSRQLRSVLTTKGDLYVATASDTVARQGVGANGQILVADSGQTNGIKWAYPTLGVTTVKTADYTITDTDQVNVVAVNPGGSTVNITLPTAADNDGRIICLKKTDTTDGPVNLVAEGSDTIDGAGSKLLFMPQEEIMVKCDAANAKWNIIGRYYGVVKTDAWADSEANCTTAVSLTRVGNRIHVFMISSVTGAFAGSNFDITIPSQYAPDALYVFTNSKTYNVGSARLIDAGTTSAEGMMRLTSTTNVRVNVLTAGSTYVGFDAVTSTVPFTWANNDSILAQDMGWIVSGWTS